MTNPFLLSEIDAAKPTQQDSNPFALPAIQADQRQDLRNTLTGAVRENPDHAAEAERLAKRYPAPNEVLLRNLRDVQLQEAVDKADEKLQTSVKLADYMRTSPFAAKQMHDDIDPLSGLEQVFAERADRTALGTVGDVAVVGAKGAIGLPQALVGLLNIPTFGYAGKGVEAMGIRFEDAQNFLDTLYSPAQQQSNAAVREAQGFIDTVGAMLQNPSTIATTVGESAPQILGGAAIGRGLIAAAPKLAPWLAAALGEGLLGAGATSEQIREGTEDGLLSAKQVFASTMSGAGTALFGAVGGRAAQRLGLGDIDTVLVERGVDAASAATLKRGFVTRIAAAGISEGVFEELPQSVQEQMWQNWATDKPLGEGVGKAAAMGMVAGFAMGGGFQAVGEAGSRLQARAAAQEAAVQRAETDGQRLQEAMQLAGASKLRERNPETFRDLAASMTDNTTVFVDAQVLAQSANELAEALPAVAEQIEGALAANSTIEIPIADLLTLAPGTPLEQVFLQNARSTPDALSLADTQAKSEQAEQFLQQEGERVMQQAVDQGAWQTSAENVRGTILEQLNTAGRFTPEVNEAYAALMRDFFSVTAARQGMTPEELYARYPLRVAGVMPGTGEQVLNTRKVGELEVEGYHFSKADRPVISTAMFGTGLQGSAREQYQNAADPRLRKRAYFYADKGTGINPEDGVGGRGQRANLTNIYDSNTDPLRLKTGRDQLGFESAVLDAGFSGYLDRLQGTQSGQVILLGDQNIQAEVLGPLGNTRGRQVPAQTARASRGRDVVVDALTTSRTLPAGAPTREMWSRLLRATMPQAHAALEAAGVLAGDPNENLYKSDLVKRFIAATPAEDYAQSGREGGDTTFAERARALLDGKPTPALATTDIVDGKTDAPAFKNITELAAHFTKKNRGKTKDLADPKVQARIADAIYAETLHGLTDAGNAIGWYDRKTRAALDIITEVHPELATDDQARFAFIAMLAVTSNGLRSRDNFVIAEQLYREGWRANQRFPETVPQGGPRAVAMGETLALLNRKVDELGWPAVRDFMVGKHTAKEVRDFAGANSFFGEQAASVVPGALFLGPKLGSFFNNLYGDFSTVTMDRWFMRTMNRVRGRMLSLPSSFGKNLTTLREQVQAGTNTFGVKPEKLLADIAAFEQFTPEQQEDAIYVRGKLKALQTYARARHRDYSKPRDDGTGKKRSYLDRTPENYLAKNLDLALTGSNDVPSNASDRTWIRGIMDQVQARLKADGVEITNADLQAVLWYYEKDLYDRLIGVGQEVESEAAEQDVKEAEDYETAARYTVARLQRQGLAAGSAGSARPGADAAGAGAAGAADPAAGDVNGRLEQAGNRGGRYSSRGLAPLEGAPTVAGATGPDSRIVAVAEQYAADNGIDLRRQSAYAVVDPERAARIAAAYEAMEHAPNDPKVKAQYEALKRETLAQYLALVDAGYEFTFFDGTNDPYNGNPWNAMRDLRANQRMAVYGTYYGYGTEGVTQGAVADNPMLADTGLRWSDQAGVEHPVLFNDLFRAVHDAFGHGLEGAGFRAQGEENAWQAHHGLFSPAAIGALTSETRGQNSWLNYGPYGEKNQTAKVEDTVFADQKTGLMPEWTWTEGVVGDVSEVFDQAPLVQQSLETSYTDEQGENYTITLRQEMLGMGADRSLAVIVDARTADGNRRATVNFEVSGNTLAAGNTMTAPAYRRRGLAEAMYRAARDAGYDIMPGRQQTADGEKMVSRLREKGLINRDRPLEQGPRGTFNPQTLLITLGKNADLTTFLHESGHFFLEVMADLASQPGAPVGTSADMAQLLKWFGVQDPATWNSYTLDQKRPHHEKFAESFEQYLFEGKAPSVELQPLFRRFRSWMFTAYKSLTQFMRGRNLQVSDEIRQVFDRMLATDEQIAAAEQRAGLMPDFEATAEGTEKLQTRSLRDLKWSVNARNKHIKKLQKQAAELRKGVEAEVRAEVEAQPVYAARKSLRSGTKLGIDGLEALYMGEGDRYALLDWKPLVDQKLAGKTGMHPDIAADMFGFANGDALVRELLTAEPIADMIEAMTNQRMLERHGDLVDQRAIEEAANEAVHNEARAKSLATELKTQGEMLNPRQDTGRTNTQGRPITVNAIVAAAKDFAANLTARRRVKDLKNAAHQHRAAEARAARKWTEATTKGDTAAAVQAKRDQVLNNATAKAMQEAQAEAKKILEFFGRVTKGNDEKTVTRGRDPDVVNAARAILAAYDIAPRLEKGALEYLAVLENNDPAMYAALQPSVAGAMNNAKPVGEMTMEELRGLKDEIDAMWHLAKRSRQMEVDGNLLDIQDAADELQARMQEIGVPDSMPGDTRAITDAEKRGRWLQHAGSLLRRAEQWAEGMDGKFGGPFLKLVFRPVKEAANRYRADRVKYRKAYQALVDSVAPAFTKGPIAAPEIGYTFGEGHNGIGHAELLHAILHTGNESNKRKLLLGRGWATDNGDGTLDTSRWDAFIQRMHNTGLLNKAHYDFAQGVWDLLEQTKPLAQKTHRDVFGRYFAEVTADEVVTPFGTYRGGYVPAQADPSIVQDADLRKLAEAENENMAYSFPATNKGFTKGRVEYNRPLLLNLRTIGQHLDKVLLFSHMEPAVRDVNKLLSQKGVSYSLGRIDPTIYAGMLTPWLSRSARQIVETPILGDGGVSRVLSAARNRAGMALMFGNVSNALQQLSGFVTAFSKIKSDGLNSHMTRATAQFISNPRQMARNVAGASPFMEGRMANEIAAINDAMDEILLNPGLFERSQAWSQKHAYFLQTAMANTMEPIVWTAGYNGALEKGLGEAEAVRYADALVRQTQGSTLPEDVSRIETGPAYARIFTQFIGYFNMMANTNGTALKQIAGDMGLKRGAGKALLVVSTGMLVPLWIAEAIAIGMRGGPEDEDDDGYLDDWLAAVFGMGTIKGAFAMVPFVGQLANAGINRLNSNPADDKVSLSPAVSLLEAGAGLPKLGYQLATDPESINARNAVRDVSSAISLATGLPAVALARPLGYLAAVQQGKVEPTSAADMARGLITGTPSPDSK